MLINDYELIEEYISLSYIFTSNIDGWCIYDKYNGKHIFISRLISDIKLIFPDMNGDEVCYNWWTKNKTIENQLIDETYQNIGILLGIMK